MDVNYVISGFDLRITGQATVCASVDLLAIPEQAAWLPTVAPTAKAQCPYSLYSALTRGVEFRTDMIVSAERVAAATMFDVLVAGEQQRTLSMARMSVTVEEQGMRHQLAAALSLRVVL